jgi:hypothetical protein
VGPGLVLDQPGPDDRRPRRLVLLDPPADPRPAAVSDLSPRHHRSNSPSPFTAYSFDLGEAAINALFVPLWMLLVPTQWPVAGLFMLHQIVRNTLGHSGYELFPATRDGRPLLPWLTT